MNNMGLKGFTILEALISLMLMSIIISLTYSVFNLIERQMILFQNENTSILQYNLFNTTIKRDIANANNFYLDNHQLLLEYYDTSKINYSITGNYILRQNHVTIDTFKVKVLNHKFLLNDPLNKTLQISIGLLNDSINMYYYLYKNIDTVINDIYFNEN